MFAYCNAKALPYKRLVVMYGSDVASEQRK